MGLDMYLRAKTYVSNSEYYKKNPEAYDEILQTLELTPDDLSPQMLSITVSLPIAYWRKANAIHNWFVLNVQNGNDDCSEYCVPREKLQELVDTCHKVLDDLKLAEELLPTVEGFFFGDMELGEMYYNELKHTSEMLLKYIDSSTFKDYDFYYQSSW